MNLHHLKCFQTIAQCQSMTQASKILSVSQPSLSKVVKSLEKNLDCPLFDRSGRNIMLNVNGRILLKYCNFIFQCINDCQEELKDAQNQSQSTVRVRLLAASRFFPQIIVALEKQYPHITLQVQQQNDGAPDFDVCISSDPQQFFDCHSTVLLKERICLAVPGGHRLAHMDSIPLSALRNLEFIALTKGRNLRSLTDSICATLGFTPKVIFESDNPSLIREMIEARLAVAFMPEISWGYRDSRHIRLMTIDNDRFERQLYLVTKNKLHQSQSLRAFINLTQDFFSRLSQ